MGDLLQSLRKEISDAYTTKSKIVWKSTRFVKVFLVLLGALLSGIFALFSGTLDWPLTVAQFGGLVGGLMAFTGGVYIVLTDEDTSDTLDSARRALDWAANQELANSEILDLSYRYEDAIEQLSSLDTVSSVARGTIERAVLQSERNTESVIRTCLEATKWNLRIALDFGINEFWTICVYRAVADDSINEQFLRLVAHHRSIECDIDQARKWRIGTRCRWVSVCQK
ncbi:hypothetical protein [Phaeobacter inhibens]|uniref:hypothetical protein n=1 Tax=Phaeobacter inhibens TaxID=221822 RepID=UPI00295F256E|nr:hypothetical protein [Phaeobacter inhibens]